MKGKYEGSKWRMQKWMRANAVAANGSKYKNEGITNLTKGIRM